MKGKFGIAALLLSSISFAAPVSTPNMLNDTPIISGGGTVRNGSVCRAYKTDGTAVNLSGGETLVFYGGGDRKNGGYLATKTTYSGTAYVKLSRKCGRDRMNCTSFDGTAIGLFARNSDAQLDFIAGAGGGFAGYQRYWEGWGRRQQVDIHERCSAASGGGWQGEPSYCTKTTMRFSHSYWPYYLTEDTMSFLGTGGSSMDWSFHSYYNLRYYNSNYGFYSSAGFGGSFSGGGASSISAFYNSYTKDYTSPPTSITITGGGITGQGLLYVCQ